MQALWKDSCAFMYGTHHFNRRILFQFKIEPWMGLCRHSFHVDQIHTNYIHTHTHAYAIQLRTITYLFECMIAKAKMMSFLFFLFWEHKWGLSLIFMVKLLFRKQKKKKERTSQDHKILNHIESVFVLRVGKKLYIIFGISGISE